MEQCVFDELAGAFISNEADYHNGINSKNKYVAHFSYFLPSSYNT